MGFLVRIAHQTGVSKALEGSVVDHRAGFVGVTRRSGVVVVRKSLYTRNIPVARAQNDLHVLLIRLIARVAEVEDHVEEPQPQSCGCNDDDDPCEEVRNPIFPLLAVVGHLGLLVGVADSALDAAVGHCRPTRCRALPDLPPWRNESQASGTCTGTFGPLPAT